MKARIFCLAGLIVLAVSILAVTRMPARAAGSWYVSNSGSDSNDCATPTTTCASINAALNKPGFVAGDAVLVATGVYTGTGTEVVLINKDATLSGGWDATFTVQDGASTINGEGARRGIFVAGQTISLIERLVVVNGYSSDSNSAGIHNMGDVTLIRVTVSNGRATQSVGGIQNSMSMIIINSTISSNNGGADGGIRNYGTLRVYNSTIANNTTTGLVGGIDNSGNALYLADSIVADNTGGSRPDCFSMMGYIESLGYNLIGNTSYCNFIFNIGDISNTTANLGTLIGIPGNTKYHPLLAGSPAINAGNPSGCQDNLGNLLVTDQRGVARAGRCDIGAYEYVLAGPVTTLLPVGGTPQHVSPSSQFRTPFQVLAMDNVGTPADGITVTFTAPASGASGTFANTGNRTTNSLTNADGIATASNFTANEIHGGYTVSATVPGVATPAYFSLNNLDWYISNSGNDSNDCTSPTTACGSINGALNKPNFGAGDRVLVATGIYTGTGAQIVLINQDTLLSGGWDGTFSAQTNTSMIEGQGARRGVTVSGTVTVTLERFVIQNGFDLGGGGGGILTNGYLTLSNSKIITNVSSYPSGNSSGGGISNSGTLTVSNSTIRGNIGDFNGGGVYNTGSATIMSSTVSGNTAGKSYYSGGGGGGGIQNFGGVLVVNNSTIANNTLLGAFSGSGIESFGSATTLNNVTLSGNTNGDGIYSLSSQFTLNSSTVSYNGGYGIDIVAGTANLRNSIVANNTADCYNTPGYNGTINSLGYNLVQNNINCTLSVNDQTNVAPLLGPLQNNGGPTFTHALFPGSPAINGGNPMGCMGSNGLLDTDQRGFPRVGRCDIGAFEYQGSVFQTNLPLILKNYPYYGINGHVTLNGVAASGVPLELRFYNGSAWSTLASTSTGADGSYSFLTAPSLTSGQRYYVRYLNSADTSRLSLWQTRVLTSYNAGTNVAIGDFDIANFIQTSPASGATVALPYLFQWNVRPSTPTDSYQFNLFNPFSSDGQPTWWTSPLGYVGSYSLNSLPTGFNQGTQYGWYVAIFSPDGGYGEPYYYRRVTFSNTGNGPQIKLPGTPKNLPEGSLPKPQSKPDGGR